MKLRSKLLALSLLTLLLPWSAWKLLQELEGFLRESQEQALLASARTMVGVIPLGFQTRLAFLPDRYVPMRDLQRQPVLDGYANDWPDVSSRFVVTSDDGKLGAGIVAGNYRGRLYLLINVRGAGREAGRAPRGRVELEARDPRGLNRFTIQPEAPGPLQLQSERQGAGFMQGYWLDTNDGYRLELVLPAPAEGTDISLLVQDMDPAGIGEPPRIASTAGGSSSWVSLVGEWREVSDWMSRSGLASARNWLVDRQGRVLAAANTNDDASEGTRKTTWLQRVLYRLVAGQHTQLTEPPPARPVVFTGGAVSDALAGQAASDWTSDPESAVVWNTVAVPVEIEGEIRGAVVMRSTSDGLLLMTNRAMGRLLFTTLALTLVLAAALWSFASRLSGRVQRLSGMVSRAMEDGADPESLPLVGDRDELGELARNNQKLLRAVKEYSQYLQTLASKLSHELKTPLAITRSSLDNLASHPLDEESQRFLERAREGVDRQTAIVRAMSEASRLESAIGAAEWDEVDLVQLITSCAEGYRAVHPDRKLKLELPEGPCTLHCAPDLLAQALDKLVDNAMSLSSDEDEVTVLLEPATETGRHYTLSVCNTGTSLPDDMQDRLFDSLVSMRDKRGAEPHLGLGLYIVRLVAAAHEGKVTARNLPEDAGVEFRVRL